MNQSRRQTPILNVTVPQHASNSGGESRSFKEAVIHGNEIPRISQASAGSQAESRNYSQSDSLEICLKVIIKCGQDNKWEVQWAGVMDKPSVDPVSIQATESLDPQPIKSGPSVIIKPNLATLVTKPVTHGDPKIQTQAHKPGMMVQARKSVTRPITLRYVWRPRCGSQTVLGGAGEASGTQELDHVSVHSEDSESQYSVSSVVPISQLHLSPRSFKGLVGWPRHGVLRMTGSSTSGMAGGFACRWS